jgi:hypothetical protein
MLSNFFKNFLKLLFGKIKTINFYSNETVRQLDNSNSGNLNGELSWLRCTRFRPPKLPRQYSIRRSLKRKPGSHPRIPFTKYQQDILENKYKKNAYLLRKDVLFLSDFLHLPQNRVSNLFIIQKRNAFFI